MQQNSVNKVLLSWGILALLGLTRGSSFILMKKGLVVFAPQELAALRIFSAAVFLFPLSLYYLGQLNKRHYGYILLSGLAGALLPAFLFAQAQTHLDSSVSGILNALVPVFVLLIGNVWFGQTIVKNELLGALVGLLGASLLILAGSGTEGNCVTYYALLPLLGCCLYGVNINLVKYRLQGLPPTAIASLSFLFIGVIAGIVLFTQTNFVYKLKTVEGAYMAAGYVSFLGIWGTAMAQLF